MKSVIHTVIGKSGEEITEFLPTPKMILFAIEKAKAPDESDAELARRSGSNPNMPNAWARKYGELYKVWLDEFVEGASFSRESEVLELVGMIQASQGNFSFWKEMARKHGVIKDEVKELSLTINTDFSQILVGDPNEARRRILLETRGVVVPTRPGVAAPTGIGQQEGAGSGAGDVLQKPMEIPNTLDSDGRQPEQGKSVSVVPKQNPPSGSRRILANRKIPSST